MRKTNFSVVSRRFVWFASKIGLKYYKLPVSLQPPFPYETPRIPT